MRGDGLEEGRGQQLAPLSLGPTLASHVAEAEADEIELLRSHEYNLLAIVLGRAPERDLVGRLVELRGDHSALGSAHIALAQAAAAADLDAVQREFFDLFVGLGRGELLPYASYYLTGFLNERPLARVREDLGALGIERAPDQHEPEDHIAILLEVMAGLASGRFAADRSAERGFFERHLKPWAERFFADLEAAKSARFYRAVGALGRLFMEIEAEAFAMDAQ
jgi:TorA maturation chaperone TorD